MSSYGALAALDSRYITISTELARLVRLDKQHGDRVTYVFLADGRKYRVIGWVREGVELDIKKLCASISTWWLVYACVCYLDARPNPPVS
jgi:hypothetical protein